MSRSRMGALVGALAGSLALGALPLGAAALSPANAAKAQRTTYYSSVALATLNIRHALSTSAARADVVKLAATGVDVIGLQEMASRKRRDAVMAAVQNCDGCQMRGVFFSSPANIGAVPILYRADRFDLFDSGSLMLSDRTYIGARGAGPSELPPKYANWVKLQEKRTGRFFYVINSHSVASVQAPDGGANDNTRRLALYRKHMAGLSSLVSQFKRRQTGIFVLGDLNVNYRRDRVVRDRLFPFVNMGAVDVEASYEHLGVPRTGTHERRDGGTDTRLIDYVYFMPRLPFTPRSQTVLSGYNTDHRPLSVGFNLKAPGPERVPEPTPRW